MDLDDVDLTATADDDVELLDVKPELEEEEMPPAPSQGRGKGKQIDDRDEMRGLQNVRDFDAGLAKGMEGMADQVYKGKGLTDSIETVQVSAFLGTVPGRCAL